MVDCPTEGGSYLWRLLVFLLLRTFVWGQTKALKWPAVAAVWGSVVEIDPFESVSLYLS